MTFMTSFCGLPAQTGRAISAVKAQPRATPAPCNFRAAAVTATAAGIGEHHQDFENLPVKELGKPQR
jgi:acyl-CoA reductase-like NAD-dependent aldehyde dehydrogenase